MLGHLLLSKERLLLIPDGMSVGEFEIYAVLGISSW